MCSHADLEPEQRDVTLHIYMSKFAEMDPDSQDPWAKSEDISVDWKVYGKSVKDFSDVWLKINSAFRGAAYDSYVFRKLLEISMRRIDRLLNVDCKVVKKKEGMTAAEREDAKMKDKLTDSFRKFQNVIKACALKNITLRLVDKLERERGGKRYFYRPISAVKSKHKLK